MDEMQPRIGPIQTQAWTNLGRDGNEDEIHLRTDPDTGLDGVGVGLGPSWTENRTEEWRTGPDRSSWTEDWTEEWRRCRLGLASE